MQLIVLIPFQLLRLRKTIDILLEDLDRQYTEKYEKIAVIFR